MEQVKLYDTTLRDGMQGEGMSLSAPEKVRIVQALDTLGVQMIEAGFPSSNPKEQELFASLGEFDLQRAVVCGFGMTRRRGVEAAEDPALLTLTGSFAPVLTLVGKTWGLHLEKVTKVSREENLAMIAESVAFCRERGKRVIYDAEHFFDAYRDDAAYAIACLRANGLAASYVSGYLATDPPPGRERMVGIDATHAWASVWTPQNQWFGFDPTNDQLVDERYVVAGFGRDYADVPPLRGIIYTDSESSKIDVSVDVAPFDGGILRA